MKSRRAFLLTAVTGTGIAYAVNRGLRYPRLSFEPRKLATELQWAELALNLNGLIVTPSEEQLLLRAYIPEPELSITAPRGKFRFSINNISKQATLITNTKSVKLIDEQIDGINRTIEIDSAIKQELKLRWELPEKEQIKVAIIGDTGGGNELKWSLQRATELNADFFLHLGDFNYSKGEYQSAIDYFYQAKMPCYISIGNHDFNESGLIYHKFRDHLGTMNNWFSLNGVRFVNVDTAADYFPASSGLRGELLEQLQQDKNNYSDTVFFSHAPLKDPRPNDDHEVGGIGEVKWLTEQLKSLNGDTWINGHVHHSNEMEVNGIHQITAGEGLGYEDLKEQQLVAKILIATLESGKKVDYQWQALNMPWQYHTSPTHQFKLKRDGFNKQLEWHKTTILDRQKA